MKVGERISDYTVKRLLEKGGMGTVYLARHTVLDQQVAIKILNPEVARKPGLKERFIQEANIQAKLVHPNIVRVLTSTNTNGDIPALIMDYVEGKSLSEVLESRGALPVDYAIKIVAQVLSAVGYAHRQGVIHRDLKPSNVMVMASGEMKIKNFGIEKVLGSYKLTRNGTEIGSAHYMSPEQIRRPESVDARSDIYSLGCVFYEVLTGRPPFGEKDASGTESDYEVKTAHVTEAVPALETVKSDIPAWLAKLVMSMLEKEPEKRPANCELIIDSLKRKNEPGKLPLVEDIETLDYSETYRKKKFRGEVQSVKTKADDVLYKVYLIVLVLISFLVSVLLIQYEKNPKNERAVSSIDPLPSQQEARSVALPRSIHERIAQDFEARARSVIRKLDKENPNNLKLCPKNSRYHNCWGQYVSSNGHTYTGEFRDGKLNGLGIDTWYTKFAPYNLDLGVLSKYTGEFKDGKRHGLGNLDIGYIPYDYYGEFKDDKRHGFGTSYVMTDSWSERYFGEFREDKRHGLGTLDANGDVYVGQFKGGQKHGLGTHSKLAFRNIQLTPQRGRCSFGNVDVDLDLLYETCFLVQYAGEWKNDKRDGVGAASEYHWDGDMYVGEFKDGKRHGQGEYIFADGRKHVGEFQNSFLNGLGIKYRADGTIEESGVYRDHRLIMAGAVDPEVFKRIESTALKEVRSEMLEFSAPH